MNSARHQSAVRPELVVMAAGVVTASDNLTLETIGDLSAGTVVGHAQSNFSDPALSYVPAACGKRPKAKTLGRRICLEEEQ